ncbi:MAG: phosphate ABC transporter permease PstA [Planctomycetes bacterium]|nr:phosphate ABC transporter permease PstA [Planctomycetota bacterium]
MKPTVLQDPERRASAMRSIAGRRRRDRAFLSFCVATAATSVLVLIVLLASIVLQAAGHATKSPVETIVVETRQERKYGADPASAERVPSADADPAALFAALDENGDGQLRRRELARDARASFGRLVDRFDRDDDDRLSAAEFADAADDSTIQWMRRNLAIFLSSPPNPEPAEAGIYPALWGTVYVCLVCALFTLPIGVGTAIFLEEFQPRNRWVKRFHAFVQLNIANLAGVPSVVYGIIGVTAFVGMFHLLGEARKPALEIGVEYYDQFVTAGDQILLVPVEAAGSPLSVAREGLEARTPDGRTIEMHALPPGAPLPDDPQLLARTVREGDEGGRISEKAWYYTRLPFGRSVLAGGLTLMLVVLPVVIIASQEALRAVPDSLRTGALGLGATRWQMIRRVTLPAAIPGIMTGSIIAMSRAIGEAAPILIISGIVYISRVPQHLMDDFTVLPLQIFDWAGRAQQPFHELAASGILVLLAVLLSFNALAVLLRHRLQKPLS